MGHFGSSCLLRLLCPRARAGWPLTPMVEGKYCIEAARAAALAAHAAAGLAATAGAREAARLLRSSEAMARAAVAVLTVPSVVPAGPAGGQGQRQGGTPRRRRGKKGKGKQLPMEGVEAGVTSVRSEAVSVVGQAGSGDARTSTTPTRAEGTGVLVPCRKARPFVDRMQRERSESVKRRIGRESLASSASRSSESGTFVTDQAVYFTGLNTRPDLEGEMGKVLSYDVAAGRFAVEVVASDERIKVLETNLRARVATT